MVGGKARALADITTVPPGGSGSVTLRELHRSLLFG
jgi:hypothetical protein